MDDLHFALKGEHRSTALKWRLRTLRPFSEKLAFVCAFVRLVSELQLSAAGSGMEWQCQLTQINGE